MSTEKSILHRSEAMNLIARNIDRILASVKRKNPQDHNILYLNDKIQKLHECWQKANQYHVDLLVAVSEEERIHLKYFSENVFDHIETKYQEAQEFISDHLYSLTEEQKQGAPNETQYVSAQSSNNIANIKLPRIDLPKFSGDYDQWTSFRDVYTSIIHDNVSITQVQKFQYLKSSLEGEARALISALTLTHDNYTVAWRALTSRYENKRMIVNSLIARLFSIPEIASDQLGQLKALRNEYSIVIDSLNGININTAHWDPLMIFLLTQKLDQCLRHAWEESLSDKTNLPTLCDLSKFLDGKIRTLETLSCNTHDLNRVKPSFKRVTLNINKSSTNSNPIRSCCFCKQSHTIYVCSKFLQLAPSQRHTTVARLQLCNNCLASHDIAQCTSRSRCRKCNRKHHTLLHFESHGSNQPPPQKTYSSDTNIQRSPSSDRVNVHFNTARANPVLLATARVRLRNKHGYENEFRALIDQGSEATFITECAAQCLRLPRSKINISINGLGGADTTTITSSTTVQVIGNYSKFDILNLNALVVRKITAYRPHENTQLPWREIETLSLADPYPDRADRIDLLLGADIYGQLIREGMKKFARGTLVAQDSIFGWILSGSVRANSRSSISVNHSSCDDLNSRLQAFWDIENVPTKIIESEEDVKCEKYFQKTTSRNEEGRFVVRLPFKHDPVVLGDSLKRATASYYGTCRSHSRKSKLKTLYDEFLREYESLNHMSAINESDDQLRVYLPHHGVLREDSATTKLRVVFNASSKTESGMSLNDALFVGPKLQNDLTGIVMNWRRHKYVLSADIEKMYRQILIHPHDRKYQCILWHDNHSIKPQKFELNTITYGTGPAPFLAMRVIKELAASCTDQLALAREILTHNIYVDDVLFGSDTHDQLRSMRDQVSKVLTSGGFVLKKWASNSPETLNDFLVSKPEFLRSTDASSVFKVLGLVWDSSCDLFRLRLPTLDRYAITKRRILTNIASIYDPLGWLSPLVVRAKCLLQSLWLLKSGWDDKLPDSIAEQWRDIVSDFSTLRGVTVPRWFGYGSQSKKCHLVGFSDASTIAYSAVVYLRVIDNSGQQRVSLIMAKSKVAPLKALSIPRLELCGALLLTRLLQHILLLLAIPINEVHCFTDSKIVLAWLLKPSYTWTTFVANRVAIIQTEFPAAIWHHVRSRENPADLNSRGISVSEFKNSNMWWSGPSWIYQTESVNEIDNRLFETKLEAKLRTLTNLVINRQPWALLSRYSSWSKLIRVVAAVLRFIKRCRRDPNANSHSRKEDIDRATVIVIKEMQRVAFPGEFALLTRGQPVDRRSKLRPLCPYLDGDNMIRVGGRLSRSDLPPHIKHPIILKADKNVEMIIRYYHDLTMHGGLQLTLRALREKFWVLNARNKVKFMIRNCVRCERYRAENASQLMSDLPRDRCVASRPFSHTGVDYAGPIMLRCSPGRGVKGSKGWIAIFICFATKAIHLEVVSDYTTDTFLAAFDRFRSRRGMPLVMYSDNGTTFQGAAAELRAVVRTIFNELRENQLHIVQGMEWRFIPPAAPHFGGLWEAGVKSMKFHLKRMLYRHTPTYEELSTLLTKIESCLNSRPLSPLKDDPEDLRALTPGHFLIGDAMNSTPQSDTVSETGDPLTR